MRWSILEVCKRSSRFKENELKVPYIHYHRDIHDVFDEIKEMVKSGPQEERLKGMIISLVEEARVYTNRLEVAGCYIQDIKELGEYIEWADVKLRGDSPVVLDGLHKVREDKKNKAEQLEAQLGKELRKLDDD